MSSGLFCPTKDLLPKVHRNKQVAVSFKPWGKKEHHHKYMSAAGKHQAMLGCEVAACRSRRGKPGAIQQIDANFYKKNARARVSSKGSTEGSARMKKHGGHRYYFMHRPILKEGPLHQPRTPLSQEYEKNLPSKLPLDQAGGFHHGQSWTAAMTETREIFLRAYCVAIRSRAMDLNCTILR